VVLSFRRFALLLLSAVAIGFAGCLSSSPDFLRATPSVRIYRIDDPDAAEPDVDDLWLGKDELEAVPLDSVDVEVILDAEADSLARPYREMAVLHVLYDVPPVKPDNQEERRTERQRSVMARAGHLLGADAVILLKDDDRWREDWSRERQERWGHDDLDREYSSRALAVQFDRRLSDDR
jgi:hypothetical protein